MHPGKKLLAWHHLKHDRLLLTLFSCSSIVSSKVIAFLLGGKILSCEKVERIRIRDSTFFRGDNLIFQLDCRKFFHLNIFPPSGDPGKFLYQVIAKTNVSENIYMNVTKLLSHCLWHCKQVCNLRGEIA